MKYDLALARRVALILGMSFASLSSALADGRFVLPPKQMVADYVAGVKMVSRDNLMLAMIPGSMGAAGFLGGGVTVVPLSFVGGKSTDGGSTTGFIPFPANGAVGDTWYAWRWAGTTSVITDPTTGSWATIANVTGASSGGNGAYGIWSRLITSIVGDSTYSSASTNATGGTAAWAMRGGTGTVQAFALSSTSTSSAGSGITITAPSVTATDAGILVCVYITKGESGFNTSLTSGPSGMTQGYLSPNNTGSLQFAVYWKTIAASGATGTQSAVFNRGNLGARALSMVIS